MLDGCKSAYTIQYKYGCMAKRPFQGSVLSPFVTIFGSSHMIIYSGGGVQYHCTLRNQDNGPVQFDDKLLCTPDDARSMD